ncbi:DsbA family protein, partial [Streptomyces spectabilis]|uniref:DsbA family protein n=1 Tax=Streptomyces spectabilis TaxID=68270 RepID=UPI0033C3503B
MTVTIDVWFDFICPYSLITRHVLARALDGKDAAPAFHPFEVNPNCVEEAGEYPRGVWENSVRPLGAERGVHLAGPPVPAPAGGSGGGAGSRTSRAASVPAVRPM